MRRPGVAGGGTLKVLWWQAPTLLNPHFATGAKDSDGSRIFYEPLASWDPNGNLVAVLAAELPTLENGGLAEDGRSVTWKLKQGVTWHDGAPFTADDVVFNWEYSHNPATAAVTSGTYKDIQVEKVDQHTVRVLFAVPQPFWADAFTGPNGQIIPKHLFEPYTGEKSREAPANRNRSLHVQGLQTWRHDHRGDQHRLPPAEPTVLQRDRAQRRRRCCLRGTGRVADWRIRLWLEHAGRG
jgi:ABC-type transport system substrate-binding protein